MNDQPEQAQAGMAWDEIAASAYRAYAASTGNKNFEGEPMPSWKTLPARQRTAWEAAVRQADTCLQRPDHAPEREATWVGWVSPAVRDEG
jgi:hypothetical protein